MEECDNEKCLEIRDITLRLLVVLRDERCGWSAKGKVALIERLEEAIRTPEVKQI